RWIRHLMARAGDVRQSGRQRSVEVTRLLSCRWHLCGKHLAASLTSPLFRPEEENSILDYWTTEVAAEIVVLQLRLGLTRSVQEEVVGIERIVAEKLEGTAVKI